MPIRLAPKTTTSSGRLGSGNAVETLVVSQRGHAMFNRYDRAALVEAINRYLGEETTAFELDKTISEIGTVTIATDMKAVLITVIHRAIMSRT